MGLVTVVTTLLPSLKQGGRAGRTGSVPVGLGLLQLCLLEGKAEKVQFWSRSPPPLAKAIAKDR
jgi:hypothetical protein